MNDLVERIRKHLTAEHHGELKPRLLEHAERVRKSASEAAATTRRPKYQSKDR